MKKQQRYILLRLLSLCCVLTMVFSTGYTAFAADGTGEGQGTETAESTGASGAESTGSTAEDSPPGTGNFDESTGESAGGPDTSDVSDEPYGEEESEAGVGEEPAEDTEEEINAETDEEADEETASEADEETETEEIPVAAARSPFAVPAVSIDLNGGNVLIITDGNNYQVLGGETGIFDASTVINAKGSLEIRLNNTDAPTMRCLSAPEAVVAVNGGGSLTLTNPDYGYAAYNYWGSGYDMGGSVVKNLALYSGNLTVNGAMAGLVVTENADVYGGSLSANYNSAAPADHLYSAGLLIHGSLNMQGGSINGVGGGGTGAQSMGVYTGYAGGVTVLGNINQTGGTILGTTLYEGPAQAGVVCKGSVLVQGSSTRMEGAPCASRSTTNDSIGIMAAILNVVEGATVVGVGAHTGVHSTWYITITRATVQGTSVSAAMANPGQRAGVYTASGGIRVDMGSLTGTTAQYYTTTSGAVNANGSGVNTTTGGTVTEIYTTPYQTVTMSEYTTPFVGASLTICNGEYPLYAWSGDNTLEIDPVLGIKALQSTGIASVQAVRTNTNGNKTNLNLVQNGDTHKVLFSVLLGPGGPAPTGCTVTFNPNGGTFNTASSGTLPKNVGDTVTSGEAYTDMAASLPGHTFLGWAQGSPGGAIYNFDAAGYPVTGDVTFYALWEQQQQLQPAPSPSTPTGVNSPSLPPTRVCKRTQAACSPARRPWWTTRRPGRAMDSLAGPRATPAAPSTTLTQSATP